MTTILICFFSTSVSIIDLNFKLGEKIYMQRCKTCHGIQGNTNSFAAQVLNPPPRNFTSKQSKSELSEARMTRSVTYGRPGTAMMPWENILSPMEISAVIKYIRRRFMGL